MSIGTHNLQQAVLVNTSFNEVCLLLTFINSSSTVSVVSLQFNNDILNQSLVHVLMINCQLLTVLLIYLQAVTGHCMYVMV